MWMGSTWRVDGHLSVSRAIGEKVDNKTKVLKPSTPSLVCTEDPLTYIS